MLTQNAHSADIDGWEMDDDLHRARTILKAHGLSPGERSWTAAGSPHASDPVIRDGGSQTRRFDQQATQRVPAQQNDALGNSPADFEPGALHSSGPYFRRRASALDNRMSESMVLANPTAAERFGRAEPMDTGHGVGARSAWNPAESDTSPVAPASRLPQYEVEYAATDEPDATAEADAAYPPSAQGGWRPWVFATAGLVGGNFAMYLGGVSTNFLPSIIIAEVALALLVCVLFYPRPESADQKDAQDGPAVGSDGPYKHRHRPPITT